MKLKFRIWDAENKEMMYQPLADLEDLYISLLDGRFYEYSLGGLNEHPVTEQLELLQFTCLFDCEAREIYEGDILARTDDEDIRYCVKFISGGFRAVDNIDDDGAHLVLLTKYSNSTWRVIGNRFENPELMGELA